MDSPRLKLLEFLRRAGAAKFANLYETSYLRDNFERCTIILAPLDIIFDEIASTASSREDIIMAIKDYMSILPVKINGYPSVITLNNLQVGNNINDLKSLNIMAVSKNIRPGLVVFVIGQKIDVLVKSGINGLINIPYDVFLQMIMTNDIKGQDLISMCISIPVLNRKCNERNQLLFSKLLQKEYNIQNNPTPRETYSKLTMPSLWVVGEYGMYSNSSPLNISQFHPNITTLSVGYAGLAIIDFNGVASIWKKPLNYKGTRETLYFGKRRIKQISVGPNIIGIIDDAGLAAMVHSNTLEELPEIMGARGVSCGETHGMLIDKEGQLWKFGQRPSFYGEMIPGLTGIKQVSCGKNYDICIDSAGQLWINGLSPSNIQTSQFTMIPNFKGVKQVSAGPRHCIFLDNEDRAWAFGDNTHKQLGLPDLYVYDITLIPNAPKSKFVACAPYHTMFLAVDGTTWVLGTNHSGLGHGSQLPTTVPVPTQIPNFNGVKRVTCAHSTTFFLK